MVIANKKKTNMKVIISYINTSINFIKFKKWSKSIILFLILINYSFNQSDNIEPKASTVNLIIEYYSSIIEEINTNILHKEYDSNDFIKELRNNISKGLIQDNVIIKTDKTIYEVSTTKIQNNRMNSNISTILLGECENKIRSYYNIGIDQKIIIFKYEYYEKGMLSPINEYEIYFPHENKYEILNLDICKDIAITILVPIYESSHFQACEDTCENLGYDLKIKVYKCKCQVKTKMNLISEINIPNLEIYDDFINLIYNEDNFNDENNIENITKTIQNALKNGIFNNYMQNALNSQPNGIIINSTNTFFQITSEFQQYNDDDNENFEDNYLSKLKLGDCLVLLKDSNLNRDPLIIFKVDHYLKGAKASIIEYKIYEKNGGEPLDLNICKDEQIKIEIPISLKEKELLKYNLSSDYYPNICYSYKTEKGTDIH